MQHWFRNTSKKFTVPNSEQNKENKIYSKTTPKALNAGVHTCQKVWFDDSPAVTGAKLHRKFPKEKRDSPSVEITFSYVPSS